MAVATLDVRGGASFIGAALVGARRAAPGVRRADASLRGACGPSEAHARDLIEWGEEESRRAAFAGTLREETKRANVNVTEDERLPFPL